MTEEDKDDPLNGLAPKLVGLIRLCSALNSKDIDFYRSIDTGIKQQSDDVRSKILDMLNRLVRSSISISTDLDPEQFNIKDGKENDKQNMKLIGDVLDTLFENVEIGMDTYKKIRKSRYDSSTKPGSVGPSPKDEGQDGVKYTYLDDADNSTSKTLPIQMKHSKIEKPQLKFVPKVDNFEKHPFRPKITAKPNAVISFEKSMELIPASETIPQHYINPYEYEIMNAKYPEWIFSPIEKPYTSVPWKTSPQPGWVDNVEQLEALISELEKCKVVGVDLEHHDYRTYHGLTSLMQISTDTGKDYIVDPLSAQLRPHLSLLNIVFTNPEIIKVFHGAFMDMMWLQRDLGLYVVSLFDTYWAAKELALGKYSLAFLLEKYIHFRTSKKWQLADWRIRPLGPEMRNYAKADTHFLVELFGKIQAELIKKPGAMKRVLYHSRKVSNRRFEYATYKPRNATALGVVSTGGSVPLTPDYQDALFSFDTSRELPWLSLMRSNGIPEIKGPVVEALYKWRDNKARQEDESIRYIMSDFVLTSLANSFSPGAVDQITEAAVLNVINRSARFGSSYYVRKCIKDLTVLIRDVMKQLSRIDLKAWQLAAGTIAPPVLSNTTNDAKNVYSSVRDVERLDDEFAGLSSRFEKLNFPGTASKLMTKRAAEGTIPEFFSGKESFGIQYSGDGKSVSSVSKQEAKARLDKIVERLTNSADAVTLPALEDMESVANEKSKTEVKETEVEEEEEEEKPKKEDKNEIITLRKHQNRNNKKRRRAQKQDGESIDLSKRILEPIDDRKRRRKHKKRSYDPYANSSKQNPNIPLVRKRKRRDLGKQATFKK